MADNYSVFNPTVDLNPYTNQIAELQRRQRMAQLLQQQGAEPIESKTVSGRVLATSPWEILAKVLQGGVGAYQENKANKAAADLREQMAYDQRQKEADVASAGQQIMGRMYGEKPPQYDKNGLLVTPRETEPAVTEPSQSSDQLGEITPTGKYQYDPSGALQMAMTPAGTEAMKGNPLMASLLAQMVKPKEAEKFGTTPVRGADGKYYLISESGRMVPTNVAGFDKEAAPTDLSKLIAERNALPADSPLRAIYDAAISKITTQSPGVTVYSGSPVAGVDEQGNPVFFQTNKAGGAPAIIPGVRPKPEAMGAAESNAATFADRMTNAERTLSTLPPVPISQRVAGAIPLVGNTLIDARNRQFNQAEQDFISAVLRKESGAAISDAEYEREAKKYIPMAGDDPETLKMKSQARKAALEGMRRSAGPSYKPAPASVGAPVSGGSNADIFSQADAILGR